MAEDIVSGAVLNILVVGFHHKRGCQVDFCFPPLSEDKCCESRFLPPQWKHLPFLALPDGAHNFDKDTIFFLLPGLDDSKNSVYGVSCYKQMKAIDLIRKSSEVTRGTVQKSVVVLSKLPLFGLINVKLQLITHAYFAERDFSKIKILKDFFNSLNTSLPRSLSDAGDAQILVGLSLVELVKKFKHKALVLFKLMLLERRVLFFGGPVHDLCTCVLSVISLFPEMIQNGLTDAACPRFYKVKSPTVSLEDFGIKTDDYFNVDMSNVPNYRQKRADRGNMSSNVQQNDRIQNSEDGEDTSRAGIQYSPRERLSRSISHDSGVKAYHSLSSLSARKMKKGTSLTESIDEEDELLNMIDEELFGVYFEEEKRKRKDRSLSGSYSKSEESRKEDLLDTDGDEALDSPNEMSCLLSYDPPETNDDTAKTKLRASHPSEVAEPEDCLDLATERERRKTKEGNTETADGHDEDDERNYEDEIIRDGGGTLQEKHLLLPEEEEANSRTTSESGISLMGGQKWEDPSEPSPQNFRPSTDTTSRQSSLTDYVVLPDLPSTPNTIVDDFGFPLSLFGKGALCHPYMALQQHDLLQDVSVRCFVVGASNVLFKHKKQMLDVIIEIETGEVNILDQDLRKQLGLTTADLRFSDYVVNAVLENHSNDTDINNTGWEGSEEWIRAQFKLYLLSLLATCADNRPQSDQSWGDFNENFVAAWKITHNHRIWKSHEHAGIDQVHTRHICHGQLSISDMKIRWNSAIQNSERGKNINNVINKTSIAMTNTGKAVGEAWTSAKSVVSTWLFGFGGDDDDDLWSYEQE